MGGVARVYSLVIIGFWRYLGQSFEATKLDVSLSRVDCCADEWTGEEVVTPSWRWWHHAFPDVVWPPRRALSHKLWPKLIAY